MIPFDEWPPIEQAKEIIRREILARMARIRQIDRELDYLDQTDRGITADDLLAGLARRPPPGRRDDCEDWDALVKAVAEDMGGPEPFPTHPPADNPISQMLAWEKDHQDMKFRPEVRRDNLPNWAQRALEHAEREAGR